MRMNDFDKNIDNFRKNKINFYSFTKKEYIINKLVMKDPAVWEVNEIKRRLEKRGKIIKYDVIPLGGIQENSRSNLFSFPNKNK